jgi:hypothetical protein
VRATTEREQARIEIGSANRAVRWYGDNAMGW